MGRTVGKGWGVGGVKKVVNKFLEGCFECEEDSGGEKGVLKIN